MIISKRCRWDLRKNGFTVFVVGVIRRYSMATDAVGSSSSCTASSATVTRNQAKAKKLSHTPVLSYQVADFLQPEKCDVLVDMTFGAGGHTRKFLERSQKVKIFCLDRDPLAFEYAQNLQKEYPKQIVPLHGKFSDLPRLLKDHGYGQSSIDGIFFDFGTSSMQFDDPQRGFALSKDGPLDMRMDGPQGTGITAADILATAPETDLHKIFRIYGEEANAKKIARAVVETRYTYKPLTRTSELRDLVASCFDDEIRLDKLGRYSHVSTKIFQALRIFVNNEMNEINHAMMLAHAYLKIGGIMVTLAFHSLEDTIVKRHITGNTVEKVMDHLPLKFYSFNTSFDPESLHSIKNSGWKAINKHVITPNAYEVDINPRSRSAKLRASIKIA